MSSKGKLTALVKARSYAAFVQLESEVSIFTFTAVATSC